MEVYSNSAQADRTVLLDFPDTPTGAQIDVFIFKDGAPVVEITTVVAIPGEGYSFVLPLHLVQYDQNLEVRWTLTYTEYSVEYTLNRVLHIEVVTPILSRREIREVWDSATDKEVRDIEKAVRHIIQAYTGQQFGMFAGTLPVRGEGNSALRTPRRLIELVSVDGRNAAPNFIVDPEGHIVRHYPWGVPPVKADYHGLHMHTGGVIHNPNNVRQTNWSSERTYQLTGRWGYEYIPEAVKEAAKLLVNDYACGDSQYRDRYLVSVVAADWRLQFHSGAYLRTGNVRADQLLSEYVVTRGWGVI